MPNAFLAAAPFMMGTDEPDGEDDGTGTALEPDGDGDGGDDGEDTGGAPVALECEDDSFGSLVGVGVGGS